MLGNVCHFFCQKNGLRIKNKKVFILSNNNKNNNKMKAKNVDELLSEKLNNEIVFKNNDKVVRTLTQNGKTATAEFMPTEYRHGGFGDDSFWYEDYFVAECTLTIRNSKDEVIGGGACLRANTAYNMLIQQGFR